MRALFSDRFVGLVLILACLIAFGRVAKCDFINFDDGPYITQNIHVRSGLSPKSIAWAFTAMHSANWHPVTWLSHMLDYEMFEMNPAGHHLMNLFLHIANALLLFLLLKNATGCFWESAAVAALFALHPLRVESVAWVSERKDVLSAFWGLTAMLVYIQYARYRTTANYLLFSVLFTLGLMAKPMLVTLPFVLLLLDFWPLHRLRFGRINARFSPEQPSSSHQAPDIAIGSLILEKIPLFLLSGASSLVTFIAQSEGGAVSTFEAMPVKVRLINALMSYWYYLGKTFWPVDLAIFYPHRGALLPLWQGIAAGVFLAAVSFLVLHQASRRPFLATGWFWFLGMLAPVIGIIQVGMQSFADRYTYLPSIGISLMIVWTVGELARQNPRFKRLVAYGSALVLCCLAAMTWVQTGYWKDTETVFRRAASVTDGNYLAHSLIGDTLAARKQLDQAREEYETALALWPRNSEAHNKLGLVLARQGFLDDAICRYEEALRINPRNASAHNNMASALVETGELDRAAEHYEQALLIEPEFGPALNGLGVVKARMERMDEAVEDFIQAIGLCPECSEPHNNLGRALTLQGYLEEAAVQIELAIKLSPENAEAYNNLGLICLQIAAFEEALFYFATATYLREDYAKARANLHATVLFLASQIAPAGTGPNTGP